MSRINYIELVS